MALFIVLMILGGLLAGIEITSPLYFGVDDNFHQFLPVILDSIHEVESGNFPAIDMHQSMGMPVFGAGTYSVTYPGTYIAYWLAVLFASPLYLIEAYAILHIIAGYMAMYFLIRRLQVCDLVAACAAASYVLGAYVIFLGRAWYYTFPTILFLPLLVSATLSLVERPDSLRRIAWWGLLCGLYFHSGNAQLWVYSMFFCGILFAMKVWGSRTWCQQWGALLLAGLLAFVIASPLLIAQYQLVSVVDRNGSSWASMERDFLNYVHWGDSGFPAYTGTFLFAAGLLSLFVRKWNVWVVLGVVAILSSLGKPGGIWLIMADAPVFEKFQHPFKFVLFATFFMLVQGAIVVDRAKVLRPVAVLNLVLISVFIWDQAAGIPVDLPYAPLSEASDTIIGDDRLYSIAATRHMGRKYSQSMSNNFPSYYGKNSISSYSDGLTFELPEQIQQRKHVEANPVEALQAYGCRWVLVHESFEMVQANPDQFAFVLGEVRAQEPIYEALESHWTERYREPHFILYEINNIAPLAFPKGNLQKSLPIEVTSLGVVVQLKEIRTEENQVIVNFLMRPGYVAMQGDKTLAIEPDEWGRIQVTLDNTQDDLQITYWPIHW